MALFPKHQLLPKHHFIYHYLKVFLEFDPLLRVWILRFKNKHTSFKTCIRNLRNFKNITFSLSEKHESFQSLLRQGAGLRHLQSVTDERRLQMNVYCFDIQNLIYQKGLNNDSMECNSAVIKGTSYKRGDVVVLRQANYQFNIEFGNICSILYDSHEKISFIVEVL